MRARLFLAGLLLSGSALAAPTKPIAAKPVTRAPDVAVRRQVAAGPTADDANAGAETPELAQLRAAERELFPPAAPSIGSAWPSELPTWREPRVEVHASGLPAPPPESHAPAAEGGRDLSWLSQLT
ncbi:MAG TPA: hypothetical protein VH054_08300, partial [Polyangiaceae bacterium]|nr:hypothetical protein [Polyangiaceae bacterium]